MNSFETCNRFAYKNNMINGTNFTSYILAAGQGKRMKSALAKPLHKIGGMAMLSWVIKTAQHAGSSRLCVVTSPHAQDMADYIQNSHETCQIAIQDSALGTGHATKIAHAAMEERDNPILVLFGDTPLITSSTLAKMADAITKGADICVLGFETTAPTGYGRLKTNQEGRLIAIVEEADASEDEKAITLVNAGVMALSPDFANSGLQSLENGNAQGEYYLTDLVAIAETKGLKIAYEIAQEAELLGVNSRADLAKAEAALQDRLRQAAMENGVTLVAPDTIFLSSDSVIEADVIIEPHTVIAGRCHIRSGAHIKSFSHLEDADVGNDAIIGPYARLRPGTILGNAVRIGNFVETKKAVFEDGAKANHLSYIGDAQVGAKANIGAGTITCNYDGYDKFKTEIGQGAFIGSNTALVAPVTIGDGAIIGAGSTITKSVLPDDLSLTRAPQKTLSGGGTSFRNKKKAKDQ